MMPRISPPKLKPTRPRSLADMLLALAVTLSLSTSAWAQVPLAVTDDAGKTVRLATPAHRIVSLAPHITENLYAAGAGEYLVGAVDFSDYPEAAKKLPRVGSYVKLDLEAIAALKPDLIIAWGNGNSPSHLSRLRTLGVPIFISKPRHFEDIATSIERFGELAGTGSAAAPVARAFRTRLAALRARYSARPPVRIFFQVWNEPLTTVNDETLIGDAIRLCGAENIFAKLPTLAPVVTIEAVLLANPEAIVASGMNETRPEWLDMWKHWRDLAANVRDNLFFIPPDIINRHTPRTLDGAQRLCEQMETVRNRRQKYRKQPDAAPTAALGVQSAMK